MKDSIFAWSGPAPPHPDVTDSAREYGDQFLSVLVSAYSDPAKTEMFRKFVSELTNNSLNSITNIDQRGEMDEIYEHALFNKHDLIANHGLHLLRGDMPGLEHITSRPQLVDELLSGSLDVWLQAAVKASFREDGSHTAFLNSVRLFAAELLMATMQVVVNRAWAASGRSGIAVFPIPAS